MSKINAKERKPKQRTTSMKPKLLKTRNRTSSKTVGLLISFTGTCNSKTRIWKMGKNSLQNVILQQLTSFEFITSAVLA